jgi:putative heme-binding domain-containing protein
MRTKAFESLVDARPDDLQSVCEALLDTRILNTVAARGLALYDDVDVGRKLAKSYKKFLPEDRSKILEILVSRKSFASALMEVLEQQKGAITVSDINAFHARQIHALNDSELSKTFKRVWGELKETSAEKRSAIESLKKSIQEANRNETDLVAGRKLFDKSCSQCHRLYGNGASIGPDLTGSQRSNLDYLLENILDPSAVVGKDFRMHVVQTEDGRTISGLLVSKDTKSVIIQTQSTKEVIPAGEIERMKETELSSMPDGLLANLSVEQIRDLIAYLMHPSQVGIR